MLRVSVVAAWEVPGLGADGAFWSCGLTQKKVDRTRMAWAHGFHTCEKDNKWFMLAQDENHLGAAL